MCSEALLQTSSTKAKVLIVEDEAVVALDLAPALSDFGYSVVGRAACSAEATRKAHATPPDVVLMDVNIKGAEDGIATAARLREKGQPAVIFLTAHQDRTTVDRALSANPAGYLTKPFRPEDLRCAIEIALLRQRTDHASREREDR